MSETPDLDLGFLNWGEPDEHIGDSPDRTNSDSPSSDSGTPVEFFTEAELAPYRARLEMERINESQWTAGNIPAGIDREDFVTVVNGAYMAYTALRKLPSVVDIQRYVKHVGAAMIKKIIETDGFERAAVARGIPWHNYDGLTAQQMMVIQILTNPTDKRPLKAKLKGASVTYPQYRAWMHQPAFSQYMNRITEGMLVEHLPDFNTVLTQKGLAGDLNAIKYINELSGRHDPNRQQVLDLQAIVQNLLDIITRNVRDPETIQRIAAEFSLQINSKQSIQGEITSGPNT